MPLVASTRDKEGWLHVSHLLTGAVSHLSLPLNRGQAEIAGQPRRRADGENNTPIKKNEKKSGSSSHLVACPEILQSCCGRFVVFLSNCKEASRDPCNDLAIEGYLSSKRLHLMLVLMSCYAHFFPFTDWKAHSVGFNSTISFLSLRKVVICSFYADPFFFSFR